MARVLIVDDTTFMRDLIRTLVTDVGHEVIAEAEDGYIAVNEYAKNRPDIVLLDILMPKMDGITTLKTIMSYDPKGRVIMISAINSEKVIKLALKFGAKGFIFKPFQKGQLYNEINKALTENGNETLTGP